MRGEYLYLPVTIFLPDFVYWCPSFSTALLNGILLKFHKFSPICVNKSFLFKYLSVIPVQFTISSVQFTISIVISFPPYPSLQASAVPSGDSK